MLHDSFSCAAKEDMLQPCAPMRRHHDEIGGNVLRDSTDFIECRCAAEDMAGRRGDVALARQHMKLFGGIFLGFLLIWASPETDPLAVLAKSQTRKQTGEHGRDELKHQNAARHAWRVSIAWIDIFEKSTGTRIF